VTREEIFRRLLSPLWLRPESALWYAHMLFAAGEMLGPDLESPSMEFGCMDGVNTFVLLGGELGPGFDVFREVHWSKQSHLDAPGVDYFDITRAIELTDADFVRRPNGQLDVGVDWKPSHLTKSARLGVYRRLELCVPGQGLPELPTAHVRTLWAPNIYWMKDLPQTLAELSRVLSPEGRIVTIAPDRRLLEHMWFPRVRRLDEGLARALDRGRYDNARHNARTREEWESEFAAAGLEVRQHRRFIPALVGETYDLGLRPMFPVFMNMYERLERASPGEWLAFKLGWIRHLAELLTPLCTGPLAEADDDSMLWHVFELIRRR